MPKDNALREDLAAQAHESWSGWMQYLFKQCRVVGNGEAVIPADKVERWARQMETPYAELPEKEKASDRDEADKYLAVIARNKES